MSVTCINILLSFDRAKKEDCYEYRTVISLFPNPVDLIRFHSDSKVGGSPAGKNAENNTLEEHVFVELVQYAMLCTQKYTLSHCFLCYFAVCEICDKFKQITRL